MFWKICGILFFGYVGELYAQIPHIEWSTYYGGTALDGFRDLTTDDLGNVYTIGSTESADIMSVTNAHQAVNNGQVDVVLSKFDNAGVLIWSTYFGGAGVDNGQGIDIDINDNVVITGTTSSAANIAFGSNVHQSVHHGDRDMFVAKFDPNGTLLWASYLGGPEGESANDVITDSQGNIIITGWSASSAQVAFNGQDLTYSGGNAWGGDIVIAKFNPNGGILWSTYRGDIDDDLGLQVKVNLNDEIFVSGWTSSPINIATPGTWQDTKVNANNTTDAFLTKLDRNGNILWSSYYGGQENEYGDALHIDDNGFIYLGGPTNTISGITTSGTWQNNNGGNYDGFLTKFDANGQRLWGTYYGGNGNDDIYGIDVNTNGDIFITGTTASASNIATANAHQEILGGNKDAFVAQLSPQGQRIWASYLGGNVDESCYGISVFQNAQIFISGAAASNTGISFGAAHQPALSAISDGFVTKFVPCSPFNIPISSNSPVCFGTSIVLTASGGNSYTWSGPNGYTSTDQNPIITNGMATSGGTYQVTVTDANNCTSSSSINVIVNNPPTATVASNSPVCVGTSIALTASGGISYTWSGPNGYTSTDQNPIITNVQTTSSGTYQVNVTDVNNCTSSSSINVVVNNPPTATIASNSPVCVGTSIALTASGGISYTWSGPNGYTSIDQNPVITNVQTTSSGAYQVTVTDVNNCTSSSSINVVVNNPPTASAGSNSPVCVGTSIALTASGGNSYTWSGPNGYTSIDQNPVITNVQTTSSGTYQVTVTDAQSCTNTASILVSVLPKPFAIISSNSPVCIGSDLRLQLSGGISYLWSGPLNFSSITQNPIISGSTTANSGVYQAIVTGQNGCTTTVTTDVIISGQLTINPNYNQPVCEGDTIKLFTGNGASFRWNGPTGFISLLQNPIIPNATLQNEGAYLLTVSDISGCSGTAVVQVDVQENPQAVIEGDTTICLHGELELTSPTIGTKTWSTGANTNTITVSPGVNTIYTLNVDLNGCIDSTSHEVGVMPLPDLSIHVDQQTIEKGQSARLEATGGDVFHWSPSEGLSCTACNITIASPQNTTSYCVEAEQNGCLADTCVQIIVNEACAIVLANIFSPNGDTNNALWCSPAKDCIAKQALWIYDRWGNLLFTGEGTDVCWDGTYSGKILQDQVCTYILRLTYTNGDLKHHTDTITLLH